MSATPLYRFQCDRCGTTEEAPLQASGRTMQPPDGWMTIRTELDESSMPRHLCSYCTTSFNKFMSNQSTYAKLDEE